MSQDEGYSPTLEDLEWLHDDWWIGDSDALEADDLRRASATLRRLLTDGELGRAWRHFGFAGQPSVVGPDCEALAVRLGLDLDLAASLVAGGGRHKNADWSFIGAFRVDNLTTGIPAEADAGFAVQTTAIARQAPGSPGPLDPMVERSWPVTNYLESTGAVRMGARIKRREIIEYFRNFAGGVHTDITKGVGGKKDATYQLIHDLLGHVLADARDGLYFELLSIG